MWLANALTLSRIPLACLFWATYGDPAWSVGVVATAGLTDALDGRVARRAGKLPGDRTAGDWLDPIADKIFVAVVLAAIYVHEHPSIAIVALIAARELLLAPLAIAYRISLVARAGVARHLRAAAIGKAATVAQFVAIVALVAGSPAALLLAIVAGVLGLAAVAHYIIILFASRPA
jgi:phosphatidylglycerophosphate synthase